MCSALRAVQHFLIDGQFNGAAGLEIGSHHLQQGAGVHCTDAFPGDKHRKAGLINGSDKHGRRSGMQAYGGRDHGLV